MQLRRNKIKTVESDVHEMEFDNEEAEVNEAEKESVLVLLENSVETLVEEQKQCIKLFYIENKSYTEISVETGLTFNQIKSFIQNGKRNLRMKLSAIRTNE